MEIIMITLIALVVMIYYVDDPNLNEKILDRFSHNHLCSWLIEYKKCVFKIEGNNLILFDKNDNVLVKTPLIYHFGSLDINLKATVLNIIVEYKRIFTD